MSGRSRTRLTTDRREARERERRAPVEAERERGARRERLVSRMRTGVVGLIAGVGLIALAFASVRDSSGGVTFEGDLRVGGTLEVLRLPVLEGDGAIEYRGDAERPLVINFFASWCPNCVAEMPEFELVHQRLGGRVVFLGVSQSDSRGASIELARETGITYETAIDEQGSFFGALGAQGMPTTVFVGPGGQIADIWVGGLNADTLERLIGEHFGVAV
jgi:thiol-disulfide isomerase/thioredoxin